MLESLDVKAFLQQHGFVYVLERNAYYLPDDPHLEYPRRYFDPYKDSLAQFIFYKREELVRALCETEDELEMERREKRDEIDAYKQEKDDEVSAELEYLSAVCDSRKALVSSLIREIRVLRSKLSVQSSLKSGKKAPPTKR